MTYFGKVLGGTIVLDSDEKPEEGSLVRVEIVEASAAQTTVGERLMKWAGAIKEGPTDSSTNLDHYLYGLPKK